MTIETVINLTPHDIILRLQDGTEVVFPKSGQEARVADIPVAKGSILGAPMFKDEVGDVIGLPGPQDGVIYIVSGKVLSAIKDNRPDVIAPGTGPMDNPIRNDKGHIVAITCWKTQAD